MFGRQLLPAFVVALIVSSGGPVLAAAEPETHPETASAEREQRKEPTSAEGRAAAEARKSGRKVAVPALTTETTTVVANPDGTFTSKTYAVAQQVKQGDAWVEVDTKLVRRPDGTVAPKATTMPTAFSAGGDRSMVTLGEEGEELALRWPGKLPEPTLAGDTATYAEVLPGVDLQLRALVSGFTQVLVVKTREAADNPRLRTLRFGIELDNGLAYKTDKHGNPSIVDAKGEPVLGSSAPLMWDSTPKPAGVAAERETGSAAAAPRDWSRKAVGIVKRSGDTMTVVPDPALLSSEETTFPVYVDPPWQAPRDGWTEVAVVNGSAVGTPKWNGAGDEAGVAKVGYSSWSSPTVLYRSYFQFVTQDLNDKEIVSAEFNALETYAPSCTDKWVDVWGTDAVNSSTVWNNQPWWDGTGIWLGNANEANGYSSTCPSKWLGFNALPIVKWSQSVGKRTSTIMLKAGGESDKYGWKKFDANSAYLATTYNSYPHVPGNRTVEGQGCVEQEGSEAHVNPRIDNDPAKGPRGPQMAATASDPDGGTVWAGFEWWTRGGSKLGYVVPPGKDNGSRFTADVPAADAPHGAKLSWRVHTGDGRVTSAWSPWCQVTVDRIGPAAEPGVSSSMYPSCPVDAPEDDCPVGTGGGLGQTGSFTLTAGAGDTDVAGFRYDLHDQPSTYVAATSGTATVQVTPPRDGPMDLYVRAVDRAGNVGSVRKQHHFFVKPGAAPVARWRLQGLNETTAYDEKAGKHHGTVSPGATWKSGRDGDALWFNGSGFVNTANGPSIRTDQSFSVSSWVKLDHTDGHMSALTQDGNRNAGFFLQYHGEADNWAFALTHKDVDGVWADVATADRTTPAGRWAHLVGVYDAGLREVRLYVDGSLADTTPLTHTRWHAAGALQMGRVKWNGSYINHLKGSMDDVNAWQRTLGEGEIRQLASRPTNEELFFPFDDAAGSTTPDDASGNYRQGTLVGGATWTSPGKVGTGALRLDGASYARTSGSVARTDHSYTVTARVRATPGAFNHGGTRTILAQDGSRTSPFHLSWRPGSEWGPEGRWVLIMMHADTDGPAATMAVSTSTPVEDEWATLTGVYDAAKKTIRLYVNGVLESEKPVTGAQWHATGPLTVGRGKYNGVLTDYWKGDIDDVHVWSGVRTDHLTDPNLVGEIRNDHRNPVTTRTTPYAGQLSRYWSYDGYHVVTSGVVPPSAHFEGPVGMFVHWMHEGGANTRMLYSCRNGADDYFLSPGADCEGRTKLGKVGEVYTTAPDSIPSIQIYRCRMRDGGRHFVSGDAACEGNGNILDGTLGYTRAYARLVRSKSSGQHDHASSTYGLSADYEAEGYLGTVALHGSAGAGGVELRMCRDGSDTFSSVEGDCEGKTFVRSLGWIWPSKPGYSDGIELHRCRMGSATGQRFDSTDPGCEGEQNVRERTLGWLALNL